MTPNPTNSYQELSSGDILREFGGEDKFAPYIEFLLQANRKINLVSRETCKSDLLRLIADCLLPFSSFGFDGLTPDQSSARLLDIGSGGGLPAFPLLLASVGDKITTTLVERTAKKAAFLSKTAAKLKLPLKVIPYDIHEASRAGYLEEVRGEVNLLTLRWVKLDNQILSLAGSLLHRSGDLLYYSSLPNSPENPDLRLDLEPWQVSQIHYRLDKSPETMTQTRLTLAEAGPKQI